MGQRRRAERRVRRPKIPYLLPQCPLQYAQGIYQGEGSNMCRLWHRGKRATIETVVEMMDREALEPLIPCFGVEPKRTKGGWRLTRVGKPALEIAKALAITPTRKKQIEEALKNAKNTGKKATGHDDKSTSINYAHKWAAQNIWCLKLSESK